MNLRPLTVAKVGGSLYDWPELGPQLRRWLDAQAAPRMVLVPGGGPAADVVRALDDCHRLGEEKAHWLALRSLSLAGHFLADLLGGAEVVEGRAEAASAWESGDVPVLDPLAFARADEGIPGCLPHSWQATSDSLAARVAVMWEAQHLVLLKSTDPPAEPVDWHEAARTGFVDPLFADVLPSDLTVRAVNLRRT